MSFPGKHAYHRSCFDLVFLLATVISCPDCPNQPVILSGGIKSSIEWVYPFSSRDILAQLTLMMRLYILLIKRVYSLYFYSWMSCMSSMEPVCSFPHCSTSTHLKSFPDHQGFQEHVVNSKNYHGTSHNMLPNLPLRPRMCVCDDFILTYHKQYDMASFEFLAIMFTGIGLMVSVLYYTFTLQNANKTQQQQLETRQAQLYMLR